MGVTLVVAGIVALLAAAAYAYVARRLAAQRPGSEPGAQRALLLFSGWWALLSANLVLGGAIYVAEGLGFVDLTVHLTYAHVQRLILAASLVCLLSYLAYLLVGKHLLLPIAAFYLAYYGWLVFTLASGDPYAVHVGTWRSDVVSRVEPTIAERLLTAVGLLAAPVAASIALLTASIRAGDASRRYRGVLVSIALLVWWVVAVVAGNNVDAEPLQTVNRFLGLAAAFAILAAYEPPGWARRRWGVRAFGEAA